MHGCHEASRFCAQVNLLEKRGEIGWRTRMLQGVRHRTGQASTRLDHGPTTIRAALISDPTSTEPWRFL
jgi:hypothetical protein